MNEFLEIHNIPKVNLEEVTNQKRLITSKETDSITKNLPKRKTLDGFTGKFHQTVKELILLKLFQKIKEEDSSFLFFNTF